jgi:hypothetical protein
VPAALFVFEGPSHRILAANRLARGSTGDRPNLIGLEIRDALPELQGQQILEILDEAFSAPAAGQPERRVLLDRNGDGALEDGFFAWTFVPVDFDDGVAGIVVHAIENTELVRQRQAAESRAVASERRFQEARDVVLTLRTPGTSLAREPVTPPWGTAATCPVGHHRERDEYEQGRRHDRRAGVRPSRRGSTGPCPVRRPGPAVRVRRPG